MSVSGDSAEQVVRLSLEGFEVIAKLTGSGAKNIAALLYTIMKDQKQTKGKTRINNMLKSGKSLKPATLDTGIEVRVPLFINDGERIVIDTRDGSFLERAK